MINISSVLISRSSTSNQDEYIRKMQLRDHWKKKNYASYRTEIPFAREPCFPNVLLITTYLLSFSLHTVIPPSLSASIELAIGVGIIPTDRSHHERGEREREHRAGNN